MSSSSSTSGGCRRRTDAQAVETACRVTAATMRRRGYECEDDDYDGDDGIRTFFARRPRGWVNSERATTLRQSSVFVRVGGTCPEGVSAMVEALRSSPDSAADGYVLVLEGVVSAAMRADITKREGGDVELFSVAEMQFDIFEHHLVPDYRHYAASRVPASLLQAGALTHHAEMCCDDVVARRLGAVPGDVLVARWRDGPLAPLQLRVRRVVSRAMGARA